MYMWILLVMFLIILILIVAVFLILKRYDIKFRVRQVLGEGIPARVYDDRAKEVNVEGVKYLKLLKNKHKGERLAPVPDPECLDVDKKGKLVVEAYYTSEAGYCYLKDNKDTSLMKPLPTESRTILVNQITKANAEIKKTLWEKVQTIAIVTILAMVIIMGMVMWGDIAKPVLDAGSQNAAITQKQAEITQLLKEIIQKEQMIKGEDG